MPKGIYKRKPRTSEHCANISKGMKNSDAVKSANKARRGVPHTSKNQLAANEMKTGVPLSPEHIAAIKKGMKKSDAVKTAGEARRGFPKLPETCAKMSEARKGVPHTPEHIAATIKGHEESGAYERMRGGHDIINHHYIYDESDLSKYTVQMTRSDHTSFHNVLRGLGYKVPHINKTN